MARRCKANMDVLVSLGTNAAYFYSVIAIMMMLVDSSVEGACSLSFLPFQCSLMVDDNNCPMSRRASLL